MLQTSRRMIQVSNLRKSYGTLVAVDGVSFDVQPGETFGLLGPNGAGKTTTILMMAGALRADSGSVTLNGASDPTLPQVRRQLGLAPQALAIYGTLTGEENLVFFGKLYGMHAAALAERVTWALDFVGLTARKNDYASTYSGGMQRRLNLAIAMLHDPPVLFLDEPTAGVDPQSRNALFENIEKLAELGRTVLYTTHYMEEAERLCDRVAIMDHGKILALDTVDALIAQHGGKTVIEAERDNETLRIETADPTAEVARLATSGVPLRGLRIDRPNLESVFLALTGRRLRD
jgi:ABC-2 type transport system ATP-binding protein